MDGVFLPRPGEPSGEWPVLPGSPSVEVVVLRRRLGGGCAASSENSSDRIGTWFESITTEKN